MGGTYNGAAAQAACTGCAKGLYNDQVGQTSAAVCKQCAPGQYTAAAGQALCVGTVCEAGKFSAGGQSEAHPCIACAAGQYTAAAGQAVCEGDKCAAGKFHADAQSEAHPCIACAAGQYTAAAGQAVCKGAACAAGKYGVVSSNIQQLCTACRPGQYTTSPGLAKCAGTVCKAGTYGPAGSSVKIACSDCDTGKFNSAPGQTECQVDPASNTHEVKFTSGVGGFSPAAFTDSIPAQTAVKTSLARSLSVSPMDIRLENIRDAATPDTAGGRFRGRQLSTAGVKFDVVVMSTTASNANELQKKVANVQKSPDLLTKLQSDIKAQLEEANVAFNKAEFDSYSMAFSSPAVEINKVNVKKTGLSRTVEVPLGVGLGVPLVLAFGYLVHRRCTRSKRRDKREARAQTAIARRVEEELSSSSTV